MEQTTTFIAERNGITIRADGAEMVSLTDLWRAAGSPGNREPYQWSRKEGEAFAEFVASSLPNKQVFRVERGRTGGTWAHWQIAMAYAKYLSHEFHAWCNDVVRGVMEKRAARRSDPDRTKRWSELNASINSMCRSASYVVLTLADREVLLRMVRELAALMGHPVRTPDTSQMELPLECEGGCEMRTVVPTTCDGYAPVARAFE